MSAHRAKPYTEAGISRVPCAHCGKPSSRQWSLRPCAIGKSAWYGLCDSCDLELNRAVVAFLKVPDGDALLAKYGASG